MWRRLRKETEERTQEKEKKSKIKRTEEEGRRKEVGNGKRKGT